MRISNIGNLSFTQLKFKRENNVVMFEDFNGGGKDKYSIEFSNQNRKDQYGISFVSLDDFTSLADEQLILNLDDDVLFVTGMLQAQGMNKKAWASLCI